MNTSSVWFWAGLLLVNILTLSWSIPTQMWVGMVLGSLGLCLSLHGLVVTLIGRSK